MLQMEDHSVRVYLPPVPDNAYASNLLYALLLRFIKASFVEGPRAAYLSINATKKLTAFLQREATRLAHCLRYRAGTKRRISECCGSGWCETAKEC